MGATNLFRIFRRILTPVKRLVAGVLLILTVNLFFVVQQLPPTHFRIIKQRVAEHHKQADDALREFFGLSHRRLSCVVPEFPLFNEDFIRIYGNDLEYSSKTDFTCESNFSDRIVVNLTFNAETSVLKVTKTKPHMDRCSLRCVGRDSDNEISFATEQVFLNWTLTLRCSEFFRLSCYRNGSNLPAFSNLYSKLVLQNRDAKVKARKSKSIKKPFNVIMFGMDGVSRQNFLRTMNKTREFFEKSSDLIDFKIYNKVRDNTFVNVVPMTTGFFADDLPWNESIASFTPFDNFPFVWKDYADKLGYRTIYAEDFAEISIFNYLKMGFRNKPTDYYFRPMNLAMSADKDSWHGHDSLCFKRQFEVDYVFDYVKAAMTEATINSNPYFAFVYLTRITHENQAMGPIADRLYSKFFRQLSADNLLDTERTIVILFSDHGTRWGSYRTTIYGKYEERLPAFAVSLPKSFRREFPEAYGHLQENARRLVTPFDVYHTLKDLLQASETGHFGWKAQHQKGSSLFNKIPETRSCEQLGVEQHWCACHELVELPLDQPDSVELALSVIHHMNAKLLQKFSNLCSNWTLKTALEVRLLKPNDKFLLFKNSFNDVNDRTVQFERDLSRTRLAFYLVTIVAKPPFETEAEAIFEATIHARVDMFGRRNNLRVEGISRLNAYGSQSECLNVHSLKPFCFCHR